MPTNVPEDLSTVSFNRTQATPGFEYLKDNADVATVNAD